MQWDFFIFPGGSIPLLGTRSSNHIEDRFRKKISQKEIVGSDGYWPLLLPTFSFQTCYSYKRKKKKQIFGEWCILFLGEWRPTLSKLALHLYLHSFPKTTASACDIGYSTVSDLLTWLYVGRKEHTFKDFSLSLLPLIAFTLQVIRDHVTVMPTTKFFYLDYKFWDQGNNYWFALWIQWIFYDLDLRQVSIIALSPNGSNPTERT